MQQETLPAGPPATHLRPLHTTQTETDDGSLSTSLSWSSSLAFQPDEQAAIKAFVELVSRISTVEPGEALCIQHAKQGGYIEAWVDSNGIAAGGWSLVPHENAAAGNVPTDFSIGSGKALQLHADSDGQVQLIAQTRIVPKQALHALGQALQDILMHGNSKENSKNAIPWTQPSVLNWPSRQTPVELQPGEEAPGHAEPALLHSWFEQRAKDSAQLVALDFLTDLETGARTQFTYRQVSNAANALAVKLHQLAALPRAAPGAVQTVAVPIGPCPELYISYLAALKAGLAFCPIPVDAPRERQVAMLADLQPVAVLMQGKTTMNSVDAIQPIVDVTPFLIACDVEAASQLSPTSVSDADAAYILYTSGTTGLPKGVIVSHRSAACTVSALGQHYGFSNSHAQRPWRWFQGAAPTFDISLFEIFWTLSTGSTLCCAPRHLTMQNIDKVISVLRADITNVTPSFASLISPSVLRGLMVGGETLNARLLKDFARHNPSANENDELPRGIYNGYGPTEVTIYSLAQPHVPVYQRGSVIGSPLATCGVLIVGGEQSDLIPVPQGAIGELVLTGPQVSTAGYLNRPEETHKAFVDDGRWGRAYRTGDRARIVWNENGEPVVEFLGRLSDAQVKLSGRRVELGEIENVLASKTRGVQQTLACVWKPSTSLGSERVVSLVVVDPKSGLDFAAVRAACAEAARQYLPDYMRPFQILEVDEMPRSASGKANRKAASEYVHKMLQQQTVDASLISEGQSAEKALENAEDARVETELVKILSAIVGESTPGSTNSGPVMTATTKLVAAGIDSLRAMRLLREIRSQLIEQEDQTSHKRQLQPSLAMLLDPDASIRSVFFASTTTATALHSKQTEARQRVDDFASRHSAASLERLCTTLGPLTDNDVEMVLPMTNTASQLAVSFAMDHRNYISNTVLPLRANVSTGALEQAVCAVFDRHAVYRSALVPCSDELSPFSQVVLTPSAWQRCTAGRPRIVRIRGDTSASNTQSWLDVAQQQLDFDLQQLYYVQLIESEQAKDTDTKSVGLLIISIAHCLCDGASVELLLKDIARAYAGLESPTRLSVQDAVLDWAANLDAEIDRHWQVSLRDWEAERFHALSGDNVKASGDYKHALAEFSSNVSWTALEAKSRSMGASPLSVLQAAWSLLLKVWSEANTEDIVFGSVLSGQHEAIHAPTFSVVPCRIPLPESQTVRTLLNTLIEGARFAQSHRHTSFGLLGALPYNTALALQAYGTGASDAENGEDVPWTAVQQPAIRYDFDIFSEVYPQAEALLFKVTYRTDVLSETSAQVIVHQFAALTETLLAAQPGDLAQGLLARLPHSLLSVEGTIPVPTDDPLEMERQRQERVDILHAQFENQAVATPDKLALSFYASLDAPPTKLTYAELDARANGLATVLRLEDADVIPICMHRSVELYVSILAILKAGSAWSPIDETSPVQRRTSLIARTQGKVLLTTTDSYSLVEPCLAHESLVGMRVIFVDQYANHTTAVRPTPRDTVTSSARIITGQDLAYLLWTSGTTGEPKGVMIQHYAAANAMRDLQVRVEHDEAAGPVRTLQLSAYSFDVFVQDLFFTWGLAGSVVSGTRELVLGTFTEFVNTAQPTHAHLTPSFGASIDVSEIAGSTLRFVTFIGEKLTEEVAEAWAAPEITTKAYNTYGPAENAVVSTMRQFFGKSRDRAKAANVGFPLTPCTAYVVREVLASADSPGAGKQWELVPRYGVGELALGGAQVAKGYLNNEAKTTKAFIQGNAHIGERIYLTGDMVRLNDHGFEFLGRNDDLVKITGIRIELSEISAACALVKEDEPAIEHVETLYLPRPGGDANHKVIVSFVSVKEGSSSCVDTAKIRQQIFQKAREVLPAYMVPGHVAVLDSTMPRTASNKVDRKALQAIYSSADLNVLAGTSNAGNSQSAEPKVQWRAEQLPVVQAVAGNLAESHNFSTHPLYPDDSLAGHGFSSLQVTKLAWALRRKLGCSLRVLDLMRCQTVGELVDVVLASVKAKTTEEDKDTAATATTPRSTSMGTVDAPPATWVSALRNELTQSLHGASRPANTAYILPATPVQEALLVETMIEPGAYWSHRLYNLAGLGLVDVSRLHAAWKAAAARLDILRTVFVPLSQLSPSGIDSVNRTEWDRSHGVHATVLQLVLEDAAVAWTELNDGDATTDGLASHARKTQAGLTPLGGDIPQPPWALAYAPITKTLMLSMHHALYDGESSRVLLDIVARLYHSPGTDVSGACLPMSRGLELGLLPSVAQRDDASTVWAKHLHSLVETDGAVNARFPDLTGSRQPQAHAILSAKATIPSQFLAHAVDRPDLPRLLQSAFGCVLAAVLELKTLVLGQTVSQRILHPDLARVVGPAMATLPVVIRTHAASARALWAEMGRDAASLGAYAHHLHPVDIKKMANEGSGDPHTPFPALFVYHPGAEEDGADAGLRAFHEVGQALPLHVEHPMALNIFEADRFIELTGDARRISQSMLDLVLAQVLDQARTMLAYPDVPLRQLNNFMDRTLVSVVGEPLTLVGAKIARNPAALVTKQAVEHPDWVAIEEIVLDDDDRITTMAITYSELEVLLNAIASQLAALAVATPGDVVAVYLERDTKSLAAILAVFKLNYVYLPIDGDLPAARKQLLVRDANAKLVVTTESLVGDLGLGQQSGSTNAPAVFLLPEGSDELDIIQSWSSPASSAPLLQLDSAGSDAGGYLLYTSGSTGRPKGVRVTNESLLHFVAAMTQRLAEANPEIARLGGVGKFLNVASRAFDTHLTTMFAPWHLGFCSAIGKDRNGIFANLQQVINEVGITNMGTVPSVLLQLGLRLSDVPSIRVMTFGGEKASHELFDQLGGSAGDGHGSKAALMNFYGPTEAAVGCMSHVIGHHSNARNLGLPLPGLEALLLVSESDGSNGEQIVARRGQPGEFCIAGPQVAEGYLDRPDENARSFQHTTLLATDGTKKRIYRTGDIMRMMHDGTVEFLGRRDQQTKIRGQRFEIGEVEAHIKKNIADQGALDVAAAVVDQRLIGLVARKYGALFKVERDAPAELLSPPPGKACQDVLAAAEQACQRDLPAFMVPEMVWLSKMPFLAVSGKLDTKHIIQLVRDADNALDAGISTATVLSSATLSGPEKEVLAALEEVLGSVQGSAAISSSSIRSLGIDSLSGVHLMAVLKRRGFSNVALTDLISPSCSIESLSRRLNTPDSTPLMQPSTADSLKAEELALTDLGPCASKINPADIAAILPCLPLQSSLVALSLNWLHNVETTTQGSDVPYVTQFNYQLSPGTDITSWTQAAEQVVSSEAVLRTCFVQRNQDGQIFQVVLASPPSPFSWLDGHDNNAATLVSQINSRPPIRLGVQQNGRVSLLIHHALYDGAAIAALRMKIEKAYLAITSGTPEPFHSDGSLAALQSLAHHCHLSGQQLQSAKAAWQAKLKGITPCRVERHIGQPNQHSLVPSRSTRRLAYTAAELKTRLQLQSGGGNGSVSVPTAFQLATLLVLAHLTAGSPSIVYGYTTSLRSLLPHIAADMDNFIGPCLNTVVHALLLQDADETLPHLAARVAQNHAQVSEGDMPLVTADRIQRWAGLEEKLFDSLLTINFVAGPTEEASALDIMRPLPGKARIDLALTIDVDLHQDGNIELLLASAGILTEAQLESVGHLFEKLVENSANADATVGQFVSANLTASTLIGVSNGTTSSSSNSSEQHQLSDGLGQSTDGVLVSVRSLACQLLGLTETAVPAEASLYRLGLDSINVLPFVKLINKAEGVKVTPSAVIRARTLQGVASLVCAAKSKGKSRTITQSKVVGRDAEAVPDYEHTLHKVASDLLFVATPLQEGMLSASLALADQAYTYTHTMQLSAAALQQDAPDFAYFFAAVQDTVLACEILRTRFIFTDNIQAPWVGVVSPTDQSDLVSWRVSSAGVIQLRIHHALYDAGSIRALWHLLRDNYADRLSGVHGRRVQKGPFSFRPFAKQVAVAQRSAVAFWVNTVQDYSFTPVALDDGKVQQHASSSFHFSLDATTLASLHTTCRKANVALKTAMQLAWAKMLCETLYRQADIVFGEVITTSSDNADDGSDEAVVMGPTINTIPMRIQFAHPSAPGTPVSIADVLSQLQQLGDHARGPNGMASLRDIQTAWRTSRADGTDTAAGLFQSLFVFDGDVSIEATIATDDKNPIVPVDAGTQVSPDGAEKAPLYDDYPLIASFRIRDGVLHGALRAKMSEDEVRRLGDHLAAAVRYVASGNLQNTALDAAAAAAVSVAAPVAAPVAGANHSNGIESDVDMNGSTELADSVLQLAKQVVGSRLRGKVGYSTKLVNIGLDSISAIRFSNMLKKNMDIHVSVFDIIKGASVETIVRKLASAPKEAERKGLQTHQLIQDEALAKHLSAGELGLQSTGQIKSVLPVLAGQRHTLQHWLHSGKRFFEAPWVYRIADGTSIDVATAKSIWESLCHAHDILQTTFVALDHNNVPDVVQVTLYAHNSVTGRFTPVRDDTTTIQDLIETHVRETNNTPSDLRTPPSRLSFLEAADGQAIVLRVHHALYDAWSIKMILKDLASLFAGGLSLQPHQSLQFSMQEMARFRNSKAEHEYWKKYMLDAQDTVLQAATQSPDAMPTAPLGFHFKASYPDILSVATCNAVNKTQTSAAIIVAYARALGQLTGRVRPTFGLNYASRSLSSADGEQTLELTSMSLPTMTVVPMSVNLEGQHKPLNAVREHLAELTKFAQADHLHELARYNTHINILFADADQDTQANGIVERGEVLRRHRLGEPLASEYFTRIVPSVTASSTVDSIGISWLPREQLYFNVLVRHGSVSVDVSGDEDLVSCGTDLVFKFTGFFASTLATITK